jgi:hypothetical protein
MFALMFVVGIIGAAYGSGSVPIRMNFSYTTIIKPFRICYKTDRDPDRGPRFFYRRAYVFLSLVVNNMPCLSLKYQLVFNQHG